MAREERRSTAHSVVSRILEQARDTLESPDRARSRAMHRDVLRALAVFGGRLQPVGRAIAAVLASSDEAEADDSVFFESHLALALNRSGCRDDDELLELAEVHRRAGDVETARRHLTQLIARSPDWSYPFQRLGVLGVAPRGASACSESPPTSQRTTSSLGWSLVTASRPWQIRAAPSMHSERFRRGTPR